MKQSLPRPICCFLTFIPNQLHIIHFFSIFHRPEEDIVEDGDSMELERLARREKNRPVNV